MKLTKFAVLLSLLTAGTAQAAGFLLINHGARASGRGNAYAATAADPSAIWYNPAGINQLDGIHLYAGANLIVPTSEFTPADGGDSVSTEDVTPITPNFYVTGSVNEWLTLGIGVNPPYGLGIEWPADSPGADIIREQTLRSWFVTPVVGIDFSSWGVQGLSLALGPDIVFASANLQRDIPFGASTGEVELSGEDIRVGGRVGLLYRPEILPALSVGLMYRHYVDLTLVGKADFDADPTFRPLLPPDGDGQVKLSLPAMGTVGLAYDILPELQAELNVSWVGWSAYDELPITLPDGTTSVAERDWNDTLVLRVGAEYRQPVWAVRVGYEYDPTPIPPSTLDFTLPDADRNYLNAGFSVYLPYDMHVDAAFVYLLEGTQETGDEPFRPREKGEYAVSAWVAALSFGVAFGQPEAAVTSGGMTVEQASTSVSVPAGNDTMSVDTPTPEGAAPAAVDSE